MPASADRVPPHAQDVFISVIVVNYNAGPLLADNIRRLRESRGVALDIIVVDNASTDKSPDFAADLKTADLRLLRNPANLGFARACNQGAAIARGEHLLFLNPDCAVAPDSLRILVDALRAHPEAGMAGPLIVNPDGSEQRGCRRNIPDPRRAFHRLTGLHRLHPERFPDFNQHHSALPDAPAPVEAISGACMLLPRKVFEDIGGWDAGYFLHAEDLDLCQRVRDAGRAILFVPQARVLHRQGTCSRRRPVFVEWHKHKGMWRFYRKFQAPRNPALFNAAIALAIALHFALRALRLAPRAWMARGNGG